jgi:uncharacterized membrane protein
MSPENVPPQAAGGSMAFWFAVLMRFLHVASAVVAIGATVAVRFLVVPAAENRFGDALLGEIRPRLKKLVHGALGLLLVTGVYNYVGVAIPRLKLLSAQAQAGLLPGEATARLALYHPVMGLKILLALTLFTSAVLLLKPLPAMQERRRFWLALNAALGFAIVLLGAYLRRLWP